MLAGIAELIVFSLLVLPFPLALIAMRRPGRSYADGELLVLRDLFCGGRAQ